MSDTNIEWTHRDGTKGVTWNPTTGCDRISTGCDHCYALTLAKRLKGMGSTKYQTDGDPRTSGPGFGLTVHPDTLNVPLRWRDPRTVFVNSMSDLFHAKVPREFVAQVFGVMAATPQHTYQILTKRPERMARMLGDQNFHRAVGIAMVRAGHPGWRYDKRFAVPATWPLANCWAGTSIESAEHIGRADRLRETPAAVRFLSLEPLLGPLPSLDLTGIDWVIIGGESGPGARPLSLGWVRDLLAQCRRYGTAPFVKQLGTLWARDTAWGGQAVAKTDPKGGNWDFWPSGLRVREYPQAVAA
jgi:protein gp37